MTGICDYGLFRSLVYYYYLHLPLGNGRCTQKAERVGRVFIYGL